MIKVLGRFSDGRLIYYVEEGIPMFGYIAFGIIDRGTNVIQVRPTTICPLNCIFCSVDAGPFSRNRWAEFIVDYRAIVNAMQYVVRYKGYGIEALIDTIGDPLSYPWLEDLIRELKNINGIRSVALETHGALLSIKKVKKLEEAGLDRINLSIETHDPVKARYLQGVPWFDIRKVIKISEYIARETNIDLHITPLWIPGINDEDIPKIINWALRIGAGKYWPPVTIQKYNEHKYGRKVPGIRPVSWRLFWNKLAEWELELGVKLKYSMKDFYMKYVPRIPCKIRKGDIVEVNVISRGWLKGEYLGVTKEDNLLIAIIGFKGRIGTSVYVKIIHDKDCLLIGKFIRNVL